jgi:hypothetical protein
MKMIVRLSEKGRILRTTARKGRKWNGSKKSLAEHLDALAQSGLRIEQAANALEKVGPSRL